MADVTVKLSDGIREVTVEISGSDGDPLERAEAAALRLYNIATASTPSGQRAGFGGWALSSDTERSPEESEAGMSGGWAGSDRRSRLPSGWAKIRARILERDPICKICEVRPSAFCDHIIAKADDHSETGLQGVCGPCHDQKSAREGAAAATAKGRPSRTRPPEQHPGHL